MGVVNYNPPAQLGYIQGTSAFTTSNAAATDVTGMTLTATYGSRPVKITFFSSCLFGSATATAIVQIVRNVGGVDTIIGGAAPQWTAASQGSPVTMQANDSQPSGTVATYRVQAYRFSGTGSVTVNAGATVPMSLRVEETAA